MQNTPQGGQEKFVERFEKAAMQYAILAKAKQGEVTKDNLQQTFRGNLQVLGKHFDSCLSTLVSDGHLRDIGGNKYTITDDGREDIQKLQPVAVELPNLLGATTQRSGISQPQTGAGVGGGSYGSSSQGQPGREQRR